jgi:hypothetical protein
VAISQVNPVGLADVCVGDVEDPVSIQIGQRGGPSRSLAALRS